MHPVAEIQQRMMATQSQLTQSITQALLLLSQAEMAGHLKILPEDVADLEETLAEFEQIPNRLHAWAGHIVTRK